MKCVIGPKKRRKWDRRYFTLRGARLAFGKTKEASEEYKSVTITGRCVGWDEDEGENEVRVIAYWLREKFWRPLSPDHSSKVFSALTSNSVKGMPLRGE